MKNKIRAKRSTLRVVIGILISIGAITALTLLTDGKQVLAALSNISPKIVLFAVVLVVVSLIARAYSWWILLQQKVSLSKSFLVINAGYFVNTILPFRLGEIARAFLLIPSGLGFWEVLPTIALERMIDGLFAVSLLLIGLPYALDFQLNTLHIYLLGGGVMLGLLFLYLLVKNRKQILSWLETTSILGSRLRIWLVKFTRSILSSMLVLTNPLRLLQVFAGMSLCWGITAVMNFLLLRAFLPNAEFIWAVFALGAVAVGVSVPSSPGNIGLFEATITLALSAFGVDQSLAFTYALTSHAVSLIVTTSFGAFSLFREGVGLREIWQYNKERSKGEEI